MKYTHPKKYKGVRPDIQLKQQRIKAIVEKYCLKCSLFNGKEHDFSECCMWDIWKHGKIIKKKTCPFEYVEVGIINKNTELLEEIK